MSSPRLAGRHDPSSLRDAVSGSSGSCGASIFGSADLPDASAAASLSCVYQTIPHIAMDTPSSFFRGIESPKKTQPPVRMMTVLRWPTTL
eukprot:353404-Chlamydomonas_euryale.AAC.13